MGYRDEVLADNPVGYWRLAETNEFAPAEDETANNRDGQYSGTPLRGVPGPIQTDSADKAVDFSGGDDSVLLSDHNDWTPGAEFTIECWVRLSATPGSTMWLVTKTSTSKYEWGLYAKADLGVGCTFWQELGANHAFVSSPANALVLGEWAHVVVVYRSGVSVKIYVNGVEAGSSTSFTGVITNTSGGALIGKRGDGVALPLTGRIDEVALYRTALSGARVLAHYEAALPPAVAIHGTGRLGRVGARLVP